MKKIFLFLTVVVAFFACKNEPSDAPTATEQAVTEDTRTPEQIAADKAAANMEKLAQKQTVSLNSPVIGAPGAAISPQTNEFIGYVTTDYWTMYAYLRMAAEPDERRKLNEDNRNRWFKFAANGTYISGKNQEETGKGRWYYDPMNLLVYLDHEDRRDEEWSVKMNSDGTVMIWIGTKTFDETGVQVKMENATKLPG